MKKILTIAACLLLLVSFAWADSQILGVPVIDQDIFEDEFNVRYICGPTSFTEVMGYWGTHG